MQRKSKTITVTYDAEDLADDTACNAELTKHHGDEQVLWMAIDKNTLRVIARATAAAHQDALNAGDGTG